MIDWFITGITYVIKFIYFLFEKTVDQNYDTYLKVQVIKKFRSLYTWTRNQFRSGFKKMTVTNSICMSKQYFVVVVWRFNWYIIAHRYEPHTINQEKRHMCRSLRKNDIIYKKRYPIKINNVFFSISGESFTKNDN